MKKLLLLILIITTILTGCQKREENYTKLKNFQSPIINYTNYTLKTKFNVYNEKDIIIQYMDFVKHDNLYARTVMDENRKLLAKSFDKDRTLYFKDYVTGQTDRKFITKLNDTSDDIRNIILLRPNFWKESPKVENIDDYFVEIYSEKGVIYKYFFQEDELKKVELLDEKSGQLKLEIEILELIEDYDLDYFKF